MWNYIQKRHASASHTLPPTPHPFANKEDELAPVAPENVGRTGYGEIRGELRSIMGGPCEELDTFPDDMGKLERGMWYPYSLKGDQFPPFVTTSAEQNHRIWNEMQFEQLMDHHPPHEVHASELPDYHYFSPIYNETHHKLSEEAQVSPLALRYTADKTDIPRFFRSGVPKLPEHEQDWYIPRQTDGRFDWKRNIRENGYSASLFDAKGWDRRYLLNLNRPNPPMHTMGLRQWAQMPIYFRVSEWPMTKRLSRHFIASQFDKHVIFIAVYFGALIWLSGNSGHWRQLVWTNDPFNYDICFATENRKKGGFHGVI